LGTASFSAVLLGVESINTDASQPCTHHAQTCQEESHVQVSHVYSSTLNYSQKFYSTHHVQSDFFGFCIWSKQTHLKYWLRNGDPSSQTRSFTVCIGSL
jgi:hypothetical protein